MRPLSGKKARRVERNSVTNTEADVTQAIPVISPDRFCDTALCIERPLLDEPRATVNPLIDVSCTDLREPDVADSFEVEHSEPIELKRPRCANHKITDFVL